MTRWLIATLAVVLFVPASLAQEGTEMPPPPEWTKLTKEHEALKKNVGTWKAELTWFMGPQVMKSTGIARAKTMFGGRFIKQMFDGDSMGQPFTGMLLLGYDTIDKQYVSVWIESTSPVMSFSRGTAKDSETRLEGLVPNRMPGATGKTKAVTTIKWIDDNKYVLTMYGVDKDGKEVKGGEITYTRAKTELPAMFHQPWMKPTAEHKALEKLVGTWDAMTDFMGLKEKGVATFKKKGQLITQHYRGTMMQIPFEGKHVLSYDNIDKVYVAVWSDTMSPIISVSRGKATEDGTIVFKGTQPSKMKPGTKEPMILKYKWVDDNTFEMLFFGVMEGKEVPHGKIVYKRRK